MNRRVLTAAFLTTLTALSVLVAACGSSASSGATNGRFPPAPGFEGSDGDDDDDGAGDDDDDGGTEVTPTPSETVPVGTATPDPTISPEPTPVPCTATPEDMDCDGIPDVEDNIPCESFTLTITNQDVSSASILLNGEEVASTNDFPNTAPIVRTINPVSGTNVLSIGGKLAGSPGDELRFVIVNGDATTTFLDKIIVRGPGAPTALSVNFEVDVTCE